MFMFHIIEIEIETSHHLPIDFVFIGERGDVMFVVCNVVVDVVVGRLYNDMMI